MTWLVSHPEQGIPVTHAFPDEAAAERAAELLVRRGGGGCGVGDRRQRRDRRMTITEETCGCGATFTITCRYPSDARRAVAEWREGHRHASAVEPGPCSAEFPHPLVWPGRLALTPSCQLRAGHAGDHESGETRWGKTNEGDA